MEFYSAIKKKEILPFVSKWKELENITLSEVSQLRRPKIIFSLICRLEIRANTTMWLDLDHMTRGGHI
jgi:hypothetical protein